MRYRSARSASSPCCILAAGAAAQDSSDPSEDCAACHEEVVAKFQTNIHAVAARGRPAPPATPTARHMEEGGDPSLIAIPNGADGEQLCLSCHEQTHTMFSGRSVHSDTEVFCTACHQIHGSSTDGGRALLADPPSRSAGAATPQPAPSQAVRPQSRARRADCASCHNPHGGSGDNSLVDRARARVPACPATPRSAARSRSPRLGRTGDCTSCHQPHGSSNPKALTRARSTSSAWSATARSRASTVGSQPPSVHDMLSSALPQLHGLPRGDPRLEPVAALLK